jgi:hypothetical protein
MQGYSLDAHKSAFFLELSKAATVFRGDDSSCSGRLQVFAAAAVIVPAFQLLIFHSKCQFFILLFFNNLDDLSLLMYHT